MWGLTNVSCPKGALGMPSCPSIYRVEKEGEANISLFPSPPLRLVENPTWRGRNR